MGDLFFLRMNSQPPLIFHCKLMLLELRDMEHITRVSGLGETGPHLSY